ncbi:MAG: NAD-dependent epimerase/dehydratase family protein, partial [Phycisphaerales bacterium]
MNILVLGGTHFSGRSFVEQATDAGHHITVLHRSPSAEGLPGSVRHLIGDRDPRDPDDKGDGLGAIKKLLDNGERFDAVVDMCGYTPRVVRASCELLRDHTDLYLFVSTISVYPASPDQSPREDWPWDRLRGLKDPSVEELNNDTYGGLKVLCEQVVHEYFPDNHIIPRPTIIAGPNDPTDSITWWTRALATLDAVVIPEPPAGLAQFVDSRDLADFFLKAITGKLTGTFNAAGPEPGLTLHRFIDRARDALGSHTRLIEAPKAWFDEREIKPTKDIPTWVGDDKQSMYRVDYTKALSAGMSPRPMEDTIRDVRAWDIERGEPELKAGMALTRMEELAGKASSI